MKAFLIDLNVKYHIAKSILFYHFDSITFKWNKAFKVINSVCFSH